MFTYLTLKNFKSLKNVTLNLKQTKEKIKRFASIYGENGCGKTNLVSAFDFLQKSIISKVMNKSLESMPKDFREAKDFLETNEMFKNLFYTFINIKKYRMIDEKEPTEITYGFSIDNKEGYYYLKFSEKIEEEKLYYVVDKKRDVHFEIKIDNEKIYKNLNNKIFIGEKYYNELEDNIDKYWGKHTFLSIIFEEMVSKNMTFVKENISEKFLKVLDNFLDMTIQTNSSENLLPKLVMKKDKINSITEGRIDSLKSENLNVYENVLREFFTQAYSDIKDVYYVKENIEDDIKYKLYFRKMIAGKLRDISYTDESRGTKRILSQFTDLISVMTGGTVIIDEIDNGIHDVMIKNIIMSIKDEITGQLIITTHNTLLLEFLPKKEVYVIDVDYEGNKSVNCITDYDINIQKNNNTRALYFKGLLGGVPNGEYIDFEEIRRVFENFNAKEE